MSDFDFIVVGSGTGGSVVANRLSENPGSTVLVLEAGKDKRQLPADLEARVDNPSIWYTLLGSDVDWGYMSVPQQGLTVKGTNDPRPTYEPRGKMTGGSSNLYIMMHIRGHESDYDNWAYNGCPGWSYKDCISYFQKLEHQEDDTNPTGGRNGMQWVQNAKLHDPNPLSSTFIDACRELGYPGTDDFNGPNMEGAGWHHVNIKDGKRHPIEVAYLFPAMERPNLTVSTESQATRLIFEGKKCVGVEYVQNGETKTARATSEVIVCLGAIESPKLLLNSGVGHPDQITPFGKTMVADLPGVGENFHNHVLTGVIWECVDPVQPGKQNLSEAALFCKSDPGWVGPDLQIGFVHVPFNIIVGQNHPNSVSILPGVVRPLSRGWIRLASNNPLDKPLVNPNYLGCESDAVRLAQACRIARDIFNSKAFAGKLKEERMPGPDYNDDPQLLRFVRETADSYHHQAGSCKMGSDSMAVVDPQLRVYGVEGLRIADASVMPQVQSGNCHAGIAMIAERCADFIKKQYGV